MTQDEVLKELHNVIAGNQQFTTWTVSTPHLVELVNRAVKAEREAIAQMVEPWLLPEYVKKIRERGQACLNV
jgi:prophage antirepressor-like protein